LYWDIGKKIVERQEQFSWGKSVVEKLRRLVAEIPWGQNLVIMYRVKDFREREFYIRKTFEYGRTSGLIRVNIYLPHL
jgi:predicted nuclease of restriction endonuclease-like (RecB) superfamily